MGNDQSIARQENWVNQKYNTINHKDTYVSHRPGERYSENQIKGALRQEYYGHRNLGARDDFVLSSDWKRIYKN